MEGLGTNAFQTDFTRELPENCVEYSLLLLGQDDGHDLKKRLSRLEELRQSALQFSTTLTKDYIWQKQGFSLETRNENGVAYLCGMTDYGDSVDDEWLIVYILRELTKNHPGLWVHVSDTDGEFLLVEAANALPKWLSPDMDLYRVWIHGGELKIITPEDRTKSRSKTAVMSFTDAVSTLKSSPDMMFHSRLVEEEAFYRLEKYPQQIRLAMHHSLITIPRKLAYVLHERPSVLAPAVEEFYLRDAVALHPLSKPSSPLHFPPTDFVTVSVRFTKILFAQLRSQRFDTPLAWKKAMIELSESIPSSLASPEREKAELRAQSGMKLACGFEMLANKAEKHSSRIVREVAIILQDLEEDGDGALPSDEDIRSWDNVNRDDDESWLDINFEDLERELGGNKSKTTGSRGESGFGDSNVQENLRKIVSRFEAFLNDEKSGLQGAEVPGSDSDSDSNSEDSDLSDLESEGEDKDVSFDEAEFTRMMREMMGMPPETGPGKTQPTSFSSHVPPTTSDSERDAGIDDNIDEDQEIATLMEQMGRELSQHGALALDPQPKKAPRALQDEKGKGKEINTTFENDSDSVESGGDAEDLDIDYNLAKNLLESFKSQGGMSGPAGNVLAMMGFKLPRDEDDGDSETNELVRTSRRDVI